MKQRKGLINRGLTRLCLLALMTLLPLGIWAESYDLWVNYYGATGEMVQVQVTDDNATNVLGDENATVQFDPTSSTLTLNEASITLNDNSNIFTCGLSSLNVKLTGESHLGYNEECGHVFYCTNENATLTFQTDNIETSGLYVTSGTDIVGGDYYVEVNYENGLVYLPNGDTRNISKFNPPSFASSYDTTTDEMQLSVMYDSVVEGLEMHYSIDYVSDDLEDVPETVIDNSGGDDIVLLGPCTVTAWATLNDNTSATVTGKYFGLAESTLDVVLEQTNAPSLVPAPGESDNIMLYYSSDQQTSVAEGQDGSLYGNSIGSGTYTVTMVNDSDEPDCEVLNIEDAPLSLTVRVIPPAPFISPESGSFRPGETLTIETDVPEDNEPTIFYYLGDYEEGDDPLTYSNELRPTITESTTVTAWVVAYDNDGNGYESALATAEYNVWQSYGITVNDIAIYEDNRQNVLDEQDREPSVQFDGKGTLVLNNATVSGIHLDPDNVCANTGLTIWLTGENVVGEDDNDGITFEGDEPMALTFATGSTEPGILMCSYQQVDPDDPSVMTLFSSMEVTYNNLLMGTQNTEDLTFTIATAMQPIVTDENDVQTREGDDGTGLGNDIEGLGAEVIADYQVNNILYTLPGDNDGCLEVDGKKVVALNTPMTHEAVNTVAANIKNGTCLPGTPAFATVFKGMTFLLPPGSGTMTFNVRTNGAGTLNVKVGTDEPTVITSTEGFAEFDIDYAVTDNTYVLLYNTAEEVMAEARPFAPGRKITNTTEMEKATVRPRSVRSPSAPPMEPKVLEKADVATLVAGGHLIIDDADLTAIADDAFEGLPDLTFVDLSQTGITGLFIDRTQAPFSALPKETFIYMPVGNDPAEGEQNVIIGTVCPDMVLADGDAPFEAAFDFTAAKVAQARDYSSLIGNNCSIYLPFALDAETAASLGAFYELKSIDDGKVTMETVDATTANTPYMFKPAKETVSAKMVEVKTLTSAASTGDARFIGTYATTNVCSTTTEQYYCFVGSDDENAGKFVHVIDTPMEVSPFRAYIKIDGAAPGRELLLDFGEGTTDIKSIDDWTIYNLRFDADGCYTLDGRRLTGKPTTKGVYIVNGKKVVIK